MTANYDGIKEVIQLTPNTAVKRCESCNYLPKDFADAINHYLSTAHGYKLLHIGTQSALYDSNSVFHDVTAILGK